MAKKEILIEPTFRETGDKEIELLQVKMSKSQKRRVAMLAEMNGHKTLSDFTRSRILGEPMSLEIKLNQVLEMMKKLLEEKK